MARVLVACEFSGVVRDAFIRAGHDAVSCDLLPTEVPGPHIQGDVFRIINDGWDLLIAHPPCTYLANSGVRWLSEQRWRWPLVRSGADFFRAFLLAPVKRIAVENPVMHFHARDYIGSDQTQTVQPWWFGDKAMKATGLWLKNLPPLQRTNDVGPPPTDPDERRKWAECHQASPGPDRWKVRSKFYQGMADAFAAQWGPLLRSRKVA